VFYTLYHADHMRLYGDDLAALSALSDPEHVITDETAQKFLQNKISIKMTEYSFELLVKFLHTQNLISMLSVLNAHMCIEVVKGEPSAFEDDRDGTAVLSGRTPEAQRKFNSIKGRWGLVESCLEIERVKQYRRTPRRRKRRRRQRLVRRRKSLKRKRVVKRMPTKRRAKRLPMKRWKKQRKKRRRPSIP